MYRLDPMNSQSQWHFVESVPENYERYLVPDIFVSWAEDLVERAALRPGERVLDIACGTGIVARIAARKLGGSGSVLGLDLSAPMLEAARAAAAAEGIAVDWREGSAVKLPLADATFDVVFCQQGLQFFPDRVGALREMYRVLTLGGRLVLSVWGPIERSPGFAVLAEALTRYVSPEAGGLMITGPFSLSDPEELREIIAKASFEDIAVCSVAKTLRFPSSDEFVLRYAAGSALASPVAKADDKARTALLTEVAAKLRSAIDNQGLRFPIESNLVIARR
jgi:ubiquinone/menaquinone biosynthesis C-methylase UbiE